MLDGAQRSGLPVWVGFSCDIGQQHEVRLLDGPTLVDGLRAAARADVPLISIMHTEVADIDACLDVVDVEWSGPVGVYAHSGDFIDNQWVFDGVIAPDEYTAAAVGWLARGVQVIGGCCGVGPEHIRALRAAGIAD